MTPPLSIVGVADADYVHTHKWANHFARRGHRLHLVSFAPVSAAGRAALDPAVTLEDWTLPHLHIKRFWVTLAAQRRLRAILSERRADIVHAHFLGHGAWHAALTGHRPLVVSVMGGGDIFGTSWAPTSRRERLLTPFALRRSDLVTCWSHHLARVIRPLMRPGARLEILVGGVDTVRFSRRAEAGELRRALGLEPDSFVVLSPRLFWPTHNIHTIVEAIGRVRASLPRVRLVLVNHRAEVYPEYQKQVLGLIERLGLSALVRQVPGVPYDEMPLYYSAADCMVSIPNSDGTPMTVMESLACGSPAIVGDLPDYDPELFAHGETVLRVPVGDPAGLASALLELASDPVRASGLASAGRRLVEKRANYTVEMDRLEALYRGLAGCGR